MPTDAYPLEAAVKDGYLVTVRALSMPLKFQREGIRYDDLSDDEKETWDASSGTRKTAPLTTSTRKPSTSGSSTRTPSTRHSPTS